MLVENQWVPVGRCQSLARSASGVTAMGCRAQRPRGTGDLVQLELFGTPGRRRRLEEAIDQLAERFGTNIVQCANDLNNPIEMRLAPTLDFLDDQTAG